MLFKLYLDHKTRLIEWNRKCNKLPGVLKNVIVPITFFFGFKCVLALNKFLGRNMTVPDIIEQIAQLLMSMTDEEKKSLKYKYDFSTNSYKFKLDSSEQNNISFDIKTSETNKISIVNLTFVMDIGERVDYLTITYNINIRQYSVDIKANNISLSYTCEVDKHSIRVSIDNQEVHMSAEDIIRSAILKTMVNMFTINIPKIIGAEANEKRVSTK